MGDLLVEEQFCKEKVYRAGSYKAGRCQNKAKRDGFCGIHHPDSKAKRNARSDERYEARRKESSYYQLGKLQEKIQNMKPVDWLRKIAGEEKPGPCPTSSQYAGEWVELLVEIDADHTAQIRMSREDYDVLMDRGGA